MNKLITRGSLALYIAFLIWLVLFKLSFHLSKILHYHHRSLNLVPFAAPSIVNGRVNYGEMVLNCVFFIPLGLLLNANFKNTPFVRKLAVVLLFSLSAETIQYIFAIGASDITDVITNTLGGFLGLILYEIGNKYISAERLNRAIAFTGIALFVLFMLIEASHFIRRSKANLTREFSPLPSSTKPIHNLATLPVKTINWEKLKAIDDYCCHLNLDTLYNPKRRTPTFSLLRARAQLILATL